jgi:hypothetical protein
MPPIDDAETAWLVTLSCLARSARSAVDRDYRRDIKLVMDTEAPARMAGMLRRLYAGLLAIGLGKVEAQRLITKTGLDSIPKLRRAVFEVLIKAEEEDGWVTTTKVALGRSTRQAPRVGLWRILSRMV